MAASRHLEFGATGNSAIRSAVLESPSLKPNMRGSDDLLQRSRQLKFSKMAAGRHLWFGFVFLFNFLCSQLILLALCYYTMQCMNTRYFRSYNVCFHIAAILGYVASSSKSLPSLSFGRLLCNWELRSIHSATSKRLTLHYHYSR